MSSPNDAPKLTPDLRMFAGVLDSLDQGVAIFDKDRRLLHINEPMKRVTGGKGNIGWSLKDLLSRHRLLDKDGRPVSVENFPINRVFEGEETREERYEYIDSNGKHTHLLVNCVRIPDEKGDLQYAVTTIRNISRRRSNENKLHFLVETAKILNLSRDFKQRLTEKAKLTVPSLADWCAIDILKDDDTLERVVAVHKDKAMIDYSFEFAKRFPPHPEAPTNPINVIKNKKPVFIPMLTEEMYREGARSSEHLEALLKLNIKSLIIVPIVMGDRGLGAMTLAYAESGRVYTKEDLRFFEEFCHHLRVVLENARLYEEISKRDQAKDLFLASLSHELRNPLAPIKSSLELLELKDMSNDTREEIETIRHNFDHMARLLDDLLDATRFTRGAITITPKPIELIEVIKRALKSSAPLLEEMNITLHLAHPSQPIFVLGDETRLEQALLNLLSNSAKFTPADGSIWVELKRDGPHAHISVRDSGVGIHPDDLPNVFGMYYQGRMARHANGGLGLGLLLVRKIVELHGGVIEARSEGVGKGSEFVLRLPLSEKLDEISKTRRSEMKFPEGKRIHVVDDNTAAANSLVRLLNTLGLKASASYSGDEVLAHPEISTFDLMLVDVGMPRMDGYEVVDRLRKRGIEKPVIALTGFGMIEDKEKARSKGFDGHLTKPIGIKELNELFNHVFAQ